MGQAKFEKYRNLNYGRISSDANRTYRISFPVDKDPDFSILLRSYKPSGECIYCGRPHAEEFDPNYVFVEPAGNINIYSPDDRTEEQKEVDRNKFLSSARGKRQKRREEKYSVAFKQEAFTREHIIAAGLGGEHVLPSASCVKCAEITSAIELRCLRGFLSAARAHLGSPSRKPEGRPTEFPIYLASNFEVPYAMKAIVDHPFRYAAADFDVPKFLKGSPVNNDFSCRIAIIKFQPDYEERVQKLAAPGETIEYAEETKIDYLALIQMIAKIAHCYTVLALGTDGFIPLLIPVILNHMHADTGYYVGGAGYIAETKDTHWARLFQTNINGEVHVICDVQLFSFIGTPVYRAIVGRLTGPSELPVIEIGKNGLERFPANANITEFQRQPGGAWRAKGTQDTSSISVFTGFV
jgi:hypothetical protein